MTVPAQPAPCRIIDTKELEKIAQDFGPDEEKGFGCLTTTEGLLPLKAMDIDAKITGMLATTTLTQEYKNVHALPLEATYIFPLPSRAAVTKFTLQVGKRRIEGILKERGQARQEYDDAIASGHRAAITEEERPGVFTMRVGNIDAKESVKVTLRMTGPLPYSDGEATYRFPLVVAPRYIPGTPIDGEQVGDGVATDTDDVPDASRISPPILLPGFKNPIKLGLVVRVDAAGLNLKEVSSSLHAISTRKRKYTTIRLKEEERLNKDFILRLAYGDESVTTGLVTHKNDDEEEGTFLLTLVPPKCGHHLPRDVVFVLDRSGSMGGWKMVCARRATARMIDALSAEDRFAFLAFDNTFSYPDGMEGKLVEATDQNRYRAVEFVSKTEARGGTNMYKPLDEAARLLAKRDKSRQRVIVLITDGQVGNEDQLVKLVRQKARGTKVFTVGIDRAVNEAFLKRLAIPTRGLCELVESEERLDKVMAAMHRRIGRPAMTNLSIEDKNLEIVQCSYVPEQLPDLFEGVPALIMGRFTGSPEGMLVIKGKLGEEKFAEKVEAISDGEEAIRYAWARGRIRDLEDNYVAGRERDSALADKITCFSLEQNVLCRFTAFLAVDQSETISADGPMHKVVQPVEAVDGWKMEECPPQPMPVSCSAPMPLAAAAPPPSPAPGRAAPSAPKRARKVLRMQQKLHDTGGMDFSSVMGGEAPSDKHCGMGISFDESPIMDNLSCPEGLFDDLASYRTDLENIAESIEQLPALADEDDLLDEVGYILGDIELLLERMTAEGATEKAVEVLRKLQKVLKEFVPNKVTYTLNKAQVLLSELTVPMKKQGQSRKDFWK